MHSDVINKRLMIFYFIKSVHDQDEHFIFIKSKFFMKAVYPELIFINKIYWLLCSTCTGLNIVATPVKFVLFEGGVM